MKCTTFKLNAIGLFLSLFVFAAHAQQIGISGVVKDSKNGEPIIGVNIIEKNTSNGTVTDFDGNFNLSVFRNSILVVSYIGYEPQELPVNDNTFFNIELKEDAIALQEVVAIGYGSQKKKEVTGSVSSVKAENFNRGAKMSPMGLIQGKVAGLNMSKKDGGNPAETGYNIQIRGFSTLDKGAGTSPLYIVDGIPVNNIDNIAPDEIASMDVLKDGSAAAIYGTRGTNGVIIITTKRGTDATGEKANTVVEYSGYASLSMPKGSTGMATPSEYRDLAALSGGKVQPVIFPNGDYSTDWMQEMFDPLPLTHNHLLAISGGAKNFSYRASLAYKDMQGIAKNSHRNELIGKLAANQTALAGWLNLQYDLSYMKYRNDFYCGDFKQAATLNPTYPIYDEKTQSGYFLPSGSGQSNPVAAMNQKESYKDGDYFRGSVRATVNILPVPGLKVSGFAALENGNNYDYWYNSVDFDTSPDDSGKAGRKTDRNHNRLFEATADYVNQWGDHAITAILGASYHQFNFDKSDIDIGGFQSDGPKYYRIESGDLEKIKISSERGRNVLISQFGRVNYNYAGKYLLSASIRREGSSRFGDNYKWGYFPAVSAGWMMSNENFMSGIEWINELKIRVGFGITGNNLNENLRSKELLSKQGTFWYNGKWVNGYKVAQDANPDLKWEEKWEYNAGVDFSFIDNRLFGSVDAYLRNTVDLLWDYSVDPATVRELKGSTFLANAGAIQSKGIELTLNGVPVKTGDWEWITTLTFALNRNKITRLADPNDIRLRYSEESVGAVGENGIQGVNTQKIREGQAIGTFYGFKHIGITEAGALVYEKDENGKNKEQIIGNAQPLFTFGWNNVIRYRNWDLTFFFRGVYGNDVLNVKRWAYGPQKSQGLNVFMKDAKGLAKGTAPYRQGVFSDYYLEDGSYIKLDNVTLGYNLPLRSNKFVQSLRLYATGENLLTITKYSGIDPEVNTSSVRDSGIDNSGFYPSISNVMIGVNLTLK